MNETTRTSRTDVRHLASRQVMALSAQFLIGMALALIGQPSQTTGNTGRTKPGCGGVMRGTQNTLPSAHHLSVPQTGHGP